MNEQIQRALTELASRGADPGAESVWAKAFEAAPKRRRRGTYRTIAATTAALLLVGSAIAFGAHSSRSDHVVVATPTTGARTPGSRSTFTLDPRVSACFSLPQTAPGSAGAPSVRDGTDVKSRLLVLKDDGALWVLAGSRATLWSAASTDPQHSAIVWARWLTDGSILTARVGNSDVELDAFSGPNRSVPVARLPYAIKTNAPRGSCPINGYLATFGVVDGGVVFLHHLAGPWAHSCPPGASPSACTAPEEYSIEVRAPRSLDVVGRLTGDSTGGAGVSRDRIVSASRASDTIVIDEVSGNTTLRVGLANRFCCLGGQQGTAYALSPNGASLAYAAKPSGREIFVAAIGIDAPVQQLGTALWKAPDRIDAMSWTSNTLAVAHQSKVTFIAAPGGAILGEVDLNGPIRTIDYERQ